MFCSKLNLTPCAHPSKIRNLKKSLKFYLDLENLTFLTNFGFSKGVYRESNFIFEQNKDYPQYQCISDHIFRGVLYKICKNDHISPPPSGLLCIIAKVTLANKYIVGDL